MKSYDIAVIGLGYVGLPLAVAFAKAGKQVLGFDVNKEKVNELIRFHDRTNEVTAESLKTAAIDYTADPTLLTQASFLIVAVPTPITSARQPDLSLVSSASRLIGQNIGKGTTVVFESTVYPGVTEDVCVPLIEKESGLACGTDWFIGYSPERINPGDKEHTIDKIVKVVAGMTPEHTELVAALYEVVCKAGVHRAESIKVAEAAKVIENIQRDLNIALMNELAVIFNRLGIRTHDVLKAAGTKWNFHRYQPGLVGGHCIGVDPYYLMHCAEEAGVHPQVITAGRRINDGMANYIVSQIVKALIATGKPVQQSRVLVLGVTFKENVPDIRNSKVFDVIKELEAYGLQVEAYDPHADRAEVEHEYGFTHLIDNPSGNYDVIVYAVPHNEVREWKNNDFELLANGQSVLMDIKSLLDPADFHTGSIRYLSL